MPDQRFRITLSAVDLSYWSVPGKLKGIGGGLGLGGGTCLTMVLEIWGPMLYPSFQGVNSFSIFQCCIIG
jgi:hypothetical protein